MTKSSIKRYSILGLVLIAASAVTAAVLPSNNQSSGNFDQNGSLTDSTGAGNQLSCTTTNGSYGQACHNTTTGGDSDTTVGAAPSSNQTSGQDNS